MMWLEELKYQVASEMQGPDPWKWFPPATETLTNARFSERKKGLHSSLAANSQLIHQKDRCMEKRRNKS